MVEKSDLDALKNSMLPPLSTKAPFVVAEELKDHPHKFWVAKDYLGHAAIFTLLVADFGSHSEHAKSIVEATAEHISKDDREENAARNRVIVRATHLKDRNDSSVYDRDARQSPFMSISQLLTAFKGIGYEHGAPSGSALSHPILQHGIRPEHIKQIDISQTRLSGKNNQLESEPYVVLGKTSSNAKEALAYAKGDILGYYMLNLVVMNQANFAKLHKVDRFRTPSGSASILHSKPNSDINLINLTTGPKKAKRS